MKEITMASIAVAAVPFLMKLAHCMYSSSTTPAVTPPPSSYTYHTCFKSTYQELSKGTDVATDYIRKH